MSLMGKLHHHPHTSGTNSKYSYKEKKIACIGPKTELNKGEALKYFHPFLTPHKSVSTLALTSSSTVSGIC